MCYREWKGELANQQIQYAVNHRIHFMKKREKREKREKFQKYKIYIYRFFADGTLSNAKPCAECSRWMNMATCVGIKYDIYYTNEHSNLSRSPSSPTRYQPYVTYF